jgi:hypothetical protein
LKAFNLTKQKYEYVQITNSVSSRFLEQTVFSPKTGCVYYIIGKDDVVRCAEVDIGIVNISLHAAKIVRLRFLGPGSSSKVYEYWSCNPNIKAGDCIKIYDRNGKPTSVEIRSVLYPHMVLTPIKATKILPLAEPCKEGDNFTPQLYYAVTINYWDEYSKDFGEKSYTYQISQKNYEELDILIEDCENGHSVNEYWDFIIMPNDKKVKISFIKETTEKPNYEKCIVAIRKNKINNKENENMNKIFGNIKFGKVNSDCIKPSFMGIAFKARDGFCTYDIENNELTNVAGFTMDGFPLYQMPVALDAVKVGDVITMRDSNQYVVVKDILEGSFKCVIPASGVVTEILPEKNIFNFNFVVKVFNPFENMMKPTADAPFGDMSNLMPFMLMSEDKDNNDFFKMFAMMNMMQGKAEGFNPMMLMMLMKD